VQEKKTEPGSIEEIFLGAYGIETQNAIIFSGA
jgi:hypothetical protein